MQLWHRPQLWLVFHPWPGKSMCHGEAKKGGEKKWGMKLRVEGKINLTSIEETNGHLLRRSPRARRWSNPDSQPSICELCILEINQPLVGTCWN